MNKHLIFTIIAIATLCVACDKNKDNVENETSNPYPYLRISDIEVYYGMNISAAEELIFSKGYQGGYVSGDYYRYYKGNDTIYFDEVENNTINQVYYYSSLQVQPSEARGWLLHPTQTYSGKYTYEFDFVDVEPEVLDLTNWTTYQNVVSQLNSSSGEIWAFWKSKIDNVAFYLWYEYGGTDYGAHMNIYPSID